MFCCCVLVTDLERTQHELGGDDEAALGHDADAGTRRHSQRAGHGLAAGQRRSLHRCRLHYALACTQRHVGGHLATLHGDRNSTTCHVMGAI